MIFNEREYLQVDDEGALAEVVIRPRSGWISIDWKELYHFRELLYFLALNYPEFFPHPSVPQMWRQNLVDRLRLENRPTPRGRTKHDTARLLWSAYVNRPAI